MTGKRNRKAGRCRHEHESADRQTALGQHLAAAVPHRGKTWLLVLAINALMTLGMSVVLVWLSIDRVNTAYFIDVQRSELKVSRV